MSEISQAITALSTFIIACATVAAGIAAWVGLNTWKKQMIGEHESNLARQILVFVFRHRDAIAGVRNPMIWSNESEDAMSDEDREESDMQYRNYLGTARVYEKRWDKVVDIRSQLYPLLLEADAIWRDQLKKKLEPVFHLENELRITVSRYLRVSNPRNSDEARDAAQRSADKKRDILYDDVSEEDEFKSDYNRALAEVENFLRGKFVVSS